ncbi:hypothetical protein JCM24511_04422 [Saitozyma sp. JCM 24511]|nr:hypothetical protein JCM24511_04422 [Saitozyma sp. JCM 24511]
MSPFPAYDAQTDFGDVNDDQCANLSITIITTIIITAITAITTITTTITSSSRPPRDQSYDDDTHIPTPPIPSSPFFISPSQRQPSSRFRLSKPTKAEVKSTGTVRTGLAAGG